MLRAAAPNAPAAAGRGAGIIRPNPSGASLEALVEVVPPFSPAVVGRAQVPGPRPDPEAPPSPAFGEQPRVWSRYGRSIRQRTPMAFDSRKPIRLPPVESTPGRRRVEPERTREHTPGLRR